MSYANIRGKSVSGRKYSKGRGPGPRMFLKCGWSVRNSNENNDPAAQSVTLGNFEYPVKILVWILSD